MPDIKTTTTDEATEQPLASEALHDLYEALRTCRNRLASALDEMRDLRGWLSDSERAERATADEAADDADEAAIAKADKAMLKARGDQ